MPEALDKKTILILEANPQGTEFVKGNAEVSTITELLEHRGLEHLFDIKPSLRATRSDFVEKIGRYKPAIVHFIGHADADDLCIENNTGQIDLLSHDDLINLLQQYAEHIDCVVLNACMTERHAEAIAKFIPFVVGTNDKIKSNTATLYTKLFYQGIFDKSCFQAAHKFATIGLGSDIEKYQFHYTSRDQQNRLRSLRKMWNDYDQVRSILKKILPEDDTLQSICLKCFPVEQMNNFPYAKSLEEIIDWIAGRVIDAHIPPLLHLLTLMYDQFNEEDSTFIRPWLNNECTRINISPDDIKPHLPTSLVEDTHSLVHVLIEITPKVNTSHCTVDAWVYFRGKAKSLIDDGFMVDLNSQKSIEQFTEYLVQTLLKPNKLPHNNHTQVILEFILPISILSLDIDRWSNDFNDSFSDVLGHDYRVAVRPKERIRDIRCQRYWKPIPRENIRISDCSQTIDPESLSKAECRLRTLEAKDNAHSVIFKSSPEQSLLFMYIRQGLPILLWPRTVSDDKSFCMEKTFGNGQLLNLPKTVQTTRYDDSDQINQNLTLLWDDMDRLPPAIDLESPE